MDTQNLSVQRRMCNTCKYINTISLVVLAAYFFVLPGFIAAWYLTDPALKGPGIPRIVWNNHRSITPKYEKWARDRLASGVAAHLQLLDVPSTEWPIFGSVYYLWTTDILQKEWEKNNTLAPIAPKVYARKAIDAAADIVLDPVHHTWVKQHWGTNYLHRQNVFFRSLLMAGINSRQHLVGDGKHLDVLHDQIETLSAALDGSPWGILEDYPTECYPIDVFASIAIMHRAGKTVGIDNSAFTKRAIRGFEGRLLDACGLPPYSVDAYSGEHHEPSRGVGNSYVLIFAPELYPETAREWYTRYEKHFWQERITAAGFREFPRNLPGHDWGFDVDAGPIIAGFSPAANAYGVAAARANGRFDHAYTLGAQVIMASWPLPDGTLLGPRIISLATGRSHAPYLGEANLMYLLAQQPAEGFEIRKGGHLPGFVWMLFLFYFGIGGIVIFAAVREQMRWNRSAAGVPAARIQVGAWLACYAAALILFALGQALIAMLCFFLGQAFPRAVERKAIT